MAEIIDGKQIASEIRQEIAIEVQKLKEKNYYPHLTVILVGENPASQVYVRMKKKACDEVGISTETLTFPDSVEEKKLMNTIDSLNKNSTVHGILVQLPLPSHIDENRIIEKISPDKDVDGFHPINMGKLTLGLEGGFVPCTPAGILELLLRTNHSPEGKHVVIVGRSNIVGKPLGFLLLRKQKGGNATVTFCHSKTPDLKSITLKADILVAAVGRAEMIKKDMVKPGCVVIDVGVNRVKDPTKTKGYRLVGDVDFSEVSKIAQAITPVPGGVGPMTIAFLLKNTLEASKKLKEKEVNIK